MKFFQLCLVACSLVSVALAGADLDKYRKDGYFGKQNVPSKLTCSMILLPFKLNTKSYFCQFTENGPYPADNEAIRPFNISVPQSDLDYLKSRLANARFADHLPGTAFRYGMNPEELKKVVQYWNSTYDWRQQEAWLNSYPQYLTQIEGLDVHYVHVKAKENASTVIPLVTVHGWPSSFMEAYKSFEMLTTPDASGIAFEVIAPSIPGFGYGEGAHREGMENTAMARIFTKLMARLGHSKYMLQGGDWGSAITRAMAIMYPEKAMGIHVLGVFDALENLLSPERMARVGLKQLIPDLSSIKSLKDLQGLTGLFDLDNLENQPAIVAMKSMLSETDRKKLFPLKEKLVQAFEETGILHLMATKPDTIASVLIDSPVGMAAHILEKFSTFVDTENRNAEDGRLTAKFTLDEMLTNVMIYWTSGNVAATCRIYKSLIQENSGVTK